MDSVGGRVCGKLAWLRPRHTTSIWGRLAQKEQEAAEEAAKQAAVEAFLAHRKMELAHRKMELWAVRELFYIYDVDGDGRLNKDEFAMYLRGIELWGQHDVFTDADLEHGVTRQEFQEIIYGEHRVCMAQDDLERVSPGCVRRWRLRVHARALGFGAAGVCMEH
jgi:hypothetical protein